MIEKCINLKFEKDSKTDQKIYKHLVKESKRKNHQHLAITIKDILLKHYGIQPEPSFTYSNETVEELTEKLNEALAQDKNNVSYMDTDALFKHLLKRLFFKK